MRFGSAKTKKGLALQLAPWLFTDYLRRGGKLSDVLLNYK